MPTLTDGLAQLRERYGINITYATTGDQIQLVVTGSKQKLLPLVFELIKAKYPGLADFLK